jgi:hypothetical protein
MTLRRWLEHGAPQENMGQASAKVAKTAKNGAPLAEIATLAIASDPDGKTWDQAHVDELLSTTLADLGPAESPEVAKVVGDFRHFLSLAIHHHDMGAIESACRAVRRAVAYQRGQSHE